LVTRIFDIKNIHHWEAITQVNIFQIIKVYLCVFNKRVTTD